ncbi:unnamed protein product [Triticum turgidum subsp. durum]|uniref:Non-specific lipid-transfer protein n=1 Tax=Triticum turgidum subsp. durum TaxID=4567 RepID=A0A9R0TFL9_TRITD|nr:unnamed protein product [Triticum turgidum subsp. durum]
MAPAAIIRGVPRAVLIVAVLVLASRGASAALSCSTVYNTLMPCLGYLQSGGVVPRFCCGGVKKLVSTARSTPDRRTICTCLKNIGAGAAGGPYASRAAGLPRKCKVPMPWNCNSIN